MSFHKYILLLCIVLASLSPFSNHLHVNVEKHHDHHHVHLDICYHDTMDSCLFHADIETNIATAERVLLLLPLLVMFSFFGLFRYSKILFASFVSFKAPYHSNKTTTLLKSLLFHAPPFK